MSSTVDEMVMPTSPSPDADIPPRALDADAASYGEDEERLVQMAQQEAVLRLARAW